MSGKKRLHSTSMETDQILKTLPDIVEQPLGKVQVLMQSTQKECQEQVIERPETQIHDIKFDMMEPNDDPEAFLLAFEHAAENALLPREQWATLLAPLLSGDSRAIFQALPHSSTRDYDQLKNVILDQLCVSEESYRKRFRSLTFKEGAKPHTVAHELRDWGRRWLKPEVRSPEEIVELILVEQFIQILPERARQWLSSHQVWCLDRAVQLIEGFLAGEAFTPAAEDVISDVHILGSEEEIRTEGHTITVPDVPFSITEEGDADSIDHQDSEERENINNATGTPFITSVFSLSLKPKREKHSLKKLEPAGRTTESSDAAPLAKSDVFGSVYSMFDLNVNHKGQIKHEVTSDELGRRFLKPERFSLRIAQRYLRQRKNSVSSLAEKCRQYNLQSNATVGLISAWTIITEGDAKFLSESTASLATQYWPSKEIATELNRMCTSSTSRTIQLENTRSYLLDLKPILNEKLELFNRVTHGGGTRMATLFLDCIISTIKEEIDFQIKQ